MDVGGSESSSAIWYRPYESELDLPNVMALVGSELSEPYIIYTYRYFLVNWWVLGHSRIQKWRLRTTG